MYYIFIADANFGMLKRDVEIAKHLVECKQKTGFPTSVYFSSSKNTPARVSEIAAIFAGADMVSTQPISLQTMSESVLASVKRENIKPESYLVLQDELNQRGLSSFLEMIWPLPGETLESFKDGIDQLCAAKADSFIFYPLMIIGNVELERQKEQFEIIAIDDPDINSEAQIVIQTSTVKNEEYLDGIRFIYHVTSLFCLRGMRNLSERLVEGNRLSYKAIFNSFSKYCESHPNHPYVKFIDDTISNSEQYKYSAVGGILHSTLHASRSEFTNFLIEFVESNHLIATDELKLIFDIDMLSRPYVYSNTPIEDPPLRLLTIHKRDNRKLLIKVPKDLWQFIRKILNVGDYATGVLEINYLRNQMPFMPGKSLEANYIYCQDRLHKMQSL